MAYSFVQSAEGTRVTSGSTISTAYSTQNVGAGNLLVAIIGRVGASGGPPTVGQVTDDQGNYWKQAAEFAGNTSHQSCDVWFCEKAGGGNKPNVTATLLGFPLNAISGMNMQVLEYSGNSGHELVDTVGVAKITTTSVTVTTSNNLGASNDLAIAVVTGNMSAATVPTGFASRLADTTQKFWVADNVSTGSSGSTLSAAWTSLTGATDGVAVIVTFKSAGATTGPTLLQLSVHEDAFPLASATVTKTSQAFPVNPTVGNTLFALVVGTANQSAIGGLVVGTGLLPSRPQSITDTAGNTWVYCGESGPDTTTGVQWALWMVRSAKGGATTLTATMDKPSQGNYFVLMEFQGLAGPLVAAGTAQVAANGVNTAFSLSTPASVPAKSVAFAFLGCLVLANIVNPVASPWTQLFTDTQGEVFMAMQPSLAAAGTLSVSWSGGPNGGTDILLAAMSPSVGLGAH